MFFSLWFEPYAFVKSKLTPYGYKNGPNIEQFKFAKIARGYNF